MDNASTVLRTTQTKGPRVDRGDKDEKSRTHSTHRSTRYKEKYQAMREKFDKVNNVNETRQRDLENANAKIRKLQEENDLLLDAMLANPPPLPHDTVSNSKHHPSPAPSYLVAASQGYVQNQGQYQAPLPPPHHQYPSRPEHSELAPPPPHGHVYSQPSRHHQHIPHGLNGGREGGNSHHHSNGIAEPSR